MTIQTTYNYAHEAGQLVTFRVGRETYGIDIFRIREVLHMQEVTQVPNAPEFIEGVVEVRDKVIPVVDLRARLGLADAGAEDKRRIVVLDLEDRLLGVIVDDVSHVLDIDQDRYEQLPEAVLGVQNGNCISRLAKTDDTLIIVIDPQRILAAHELVHLEEMEPPAP